MNIKHISISTAAGVLTLAAVAASDSASTAAPEAKKADNSVLLPGEMKSAPAAIFTLPALPDSISKSQNPFSGEQLLKSMSPLTKSQLAQATADYTTILPDSAGNYPLTLPATENSLSVDRFATNIRPDAFFKGKLKIKTAGAAKGYINGKEVLAKNSFDSIPKTAEGSFTIEPAMDALIEFDIVSNSADKKPSLCIEILPDDDSKDVNLTKGIDLKQYFNIYTILDGTRIENCNISPDGRYLLISTASVSNGVDKDIKCSVEETATGKIIAENLPTNSNWLPAYGSTLCYDEKSADGSFSIMTIDLPSMRYSTMAERLPEEADGYMMSPNRDYIIYSIKVEGKKDSGVMGRLQSPDDRQPGKRNRYYLSMMNLKDGIARPITYGGESTYPLDISADGKKLLYYSIRETPSEFPFYAPTLVNLDLQTLKADTIPGIDSSFTEARFSPDGRRLVVMAGPNAYGGIGLNAGEFDWGNDFDIQAYIVNADGSDPRPMTRNFDPSIMHGVVWNSADSNIYFRAQAGYDTFLYRLNPESGKIEKLPSDVDFIRSWSISCKNPVQVGYTGMSYDYMGRAYTLNCRSGKSRLVADPMKDDLSRIELGGSEMVSFTAADGTQIEGTLTLPPNFNKAKKYPLIVYYYAGTTPNTHTNHSPYTPNLFASRGYVVFSLNPSGTIGYGQEFSARHVNAWGERTADEIILGTQEICRRYPFINKDKIGCIGASYGGFMTQLLQTKTDIFAAAVSHAGISNIASYWGEGFWGYSYNAVAAARSYPWNNPKLFTDHSPLFHADKIHTPLLLLHGSVDTNVPIGESIQLYNALKILGREVEFITVDNQNHIILDFQKRKEWHATIMAWFEKWLKDDPRWWNSIYRE